MVVVNKDQLYGEVSQPRYVNAYPIEMYIKNVDGFGGEGSFLSKFNLEIREEIEFSISTRVFGQEVGVAEDLSRPREADLIWFPLAGRMFKISYVDSKPVFYQLGTVAFYDLRCQLFEYSNEIFTTGIPEVDAISVDYSIESGLDELLLEDGSVLVDEAGFSLLQDGTNNDTSVLSDNDFLQTNGTGIIDFTEFDPFSEGTY